MHRKGCRLAGGLLLLAVVLLALDVACVGAVEGKKGHERVHHSRHHSERLHHKVKNHHHKGLKEELLDEGEESETDGIPYEPEAYAAEKKRVLAEDARQSAEDRRVSQELSRVRNEKRRAQLEQEMLQATRAEQNLVKRVQNSEQARAGEVRKDSADEQTRQENEAQREAAHESRGKVVDEVQQRYRGTTQMLTNSVDRFRTQTADQLDRLIVADKNIVGTVNYAEEAAEKAEHEEKERLNLENEHDSEQAKRVRAIESTQRSLEDSLALLNKQHKSALDNVEKARIELSSPIQKKLGQELKAQKAQITQMGQNLQQTESTLSHATTVNDNAKKGLDAATESIENLKTQVDKISQQEVTEEREDGEMEKLAHATQNKVQRDGRTVMDSMNKVAELKKEMTATSDKVNNNMKNLEAERAEMAEHLHKQFEKYKKDEAEMNNQEQRMKEKALDLQRSAADDVNEQETLRNLEEYLSRLEAQLELAQKGTLRVNLASVREYFKQMSEMLDKLAETSASNANKVDNHLANAEKHVEHMKHFEQVLSGKEDSLMNRVDDLHKRQSEDESLINFKMKSLDMEVEEKVRDKIRNFQSRVDKGLAVIKHHTDTEFSDLNRKHSKVAAKTERLRGVLTRLTDQLKEEEEEEGKIEKDEESHEEMGEKEVGEIRERLNKKLYGMQKLLEGELADMTAHESVDGRDEFEAEAQKRMEDIRGKLDEFDHRSKSEIEDLRSTLGEGVMGVQNIMHQILVAVQGHHPGGFDAPDHPAGVDGDSGPNIFAGHANSDPASTQLRNDAVGLLVAAGMSSADAHKMIAMANTVGDLKKAVAAHTHGAGGSDGRGPHAAALHPGTHHLTGANGVANKHDESIMGALGAGHHGDNERVSEKAKTTITDGLTKMGVDPSNIAAVLKGNPTVGEVKRRANIVAHAQEAIKALDGLNGGAPVPPEKLAAVAKALKAAGIPPPPFGPGTTADDVKSFIEKATADAITRPPPVESLSAAGPPAVSPAQVAQATKALAGHADSATVTPDIAKAAVDALVAAGVPQDVAESQVKGASTVGELKKKLQESGAAGLMPGMDPSLSDDQNMMKVLGDQLLADGSDSAAAALKLLRIIDNSHGDPHLPADDAAKVLGGADGALQALADLRNKSQKLLHDAVTSGDNEKKSVAERMLKALDRMDIKVKNGIDRLKNPPKASASGDGTTSCMRSCVPDQSKAKKVQECVKSCTEGAGMMLDEQGNDSIQSLLNLGLNELGELTDSQLEKRVNEAVTQAKGMAHSASKLIDGLGDVDVSATSESDKAHYAWQAIRGAQESVSAAENVGMIMKTYERATSNDTSTPTFKALLKTVQALGQSARQLVTKAGDAVNRLKFGAGSHHKEVLAKTIELLA